MFFFSVSFAHLVCHNFLQLLAPNLTFFFHEDLAYLACSTNDERTISAGSTRRVACATNCNNKCCSNGLLQFEIDDGTTNGWFSKCGSWFRLDSVWHRPVLGQLPVMSQEIFRVHVSLQKCLLRLPTMLHTSSPWLRPRHNNTFFNGITTRSYFLLQATTFYLSNTYHSHTMCRIRQAASDTDYC